jgi:hypothetical protein
MDETARVLVFHRYEFDRETPHQGTMHTLSLPADNDEQKLAVVDYFKESIEDFFPFFRGRPFLDILPHLVDGVFEYEPCVVITTVVRRSLVHDESLITDYRTDDPEETDMVVCSVTFPLGSRYDRLSFFKFLSTDLAQRTCPFAAPCCRIYSSRMARPTNPPIKKKPTAALHIMANALFDHKEEMTDDEYVDASNRMKRAFDEF